MKVTHDGRRITVEVTADGDGLVSHAGSALLSRVADKSGLTRALSAELAGLQLRAGSHDRGRVIRDLAVMLADGGDCVADIGALGDQAVLFGDVASTSTAFRVIDQIASDPNGLECLRAAHARARARVWKLAAAPSRLTIDLDATLLGSHSDKEGAAGNFKGGFGFHPMLAYADETGEALAGELRPGNAGANTAADQIAVAEQALQQIPAEHIESIELLLRVDSAGASHELLDWAREARIGFSVGYDLTETVRDAILQIPDQRWVAAIDQDGSDRPNGHVCEITEQLDLSSWPSGTRVLVRRERAHPGAQLTFTDLNGHCFQAILTDQSGSEIAQVERDHRARARVEDHIRNDKDTGLRNLPFRDFEHNRVWLELVGLAHDLIVWTQRLLLTGELARCEPKRLRYRLLHVAARLAFHARTATLRLPRSWPWAAELAAAFARLKALPAPA
ncbi:MAG: IS1380 family transposase [Chloroflexota bacterium]|nr:IS1380 family transposase [Chloroflexota bacterium]